MEKEEILLKLQRIIDSGDFTSDMILEMAPVELLGDVKTMLLRHIQKESDVIHNELSNKIR